MHDVERVFNYYKQAYSSKMTAIKSGKHIGYNYSFISLVENYGSILYPYTSKVCHVKMKTLIREHLISKIWG